MRERASENREGGGDIESVGLGLFLSICCTVNQRVILEQREAVAEGKLRTQLSHQQDYYPDLVRSISLARPLKAL